jgi:hypothetical protein
MLGCLAFILLTEAKRPGSELRVHPAIVPRFRHTMRAELFVGAVFLVSALPFFWVATPAGYLRFDVWYLSIGMVFFYWPRRKPTNRAVSIQPIGG